MRNKYVYICSYNIADGVLTNDLAQDISCRLKDQFKIITDQQQMRMKNIEKYTRKIHEIGVPIKFNIIAKYSMHCKFIIIDDLYLVEGSMNLGKKSLENYEHVSVHQNIAILSRFKKRFQRMWKDSTNMHFYTVPTIQ